ncbi:MAG: HPr family phosphocarrier protein [Clostridia bacterium]|nr:HPr family phosphocarrier protein [Clostridia bacterium]
MNRAYRYLYRVNLVTGADVLEFTKIASRAEGKVYLVSGDRRLSANSILGVYLAKVAWDEIYVEADYDCYFESRKYIVE